MRQRQYSIDLLRITASFMVVLLHTSATQWYAVPVSSHAWQVSNAYNTAVRSCVPLFFMISGMLFLSKEQLPARRLFTKNIARMAVVYLLWSCFYAVDTLGIHTIIWNCSPEQFVSAVLSAKYHLWYLPALISVYLILPVLHAVKDVGEGKLLRYVLYLFLAFGIALPSIALIPQLWGASELLGRIDYAFASYCGYVVLGYALCRERERLRVRSAYLLLLLAAIIALTAWGNAWISAAEGTASTALHSNFFLATFLEACLIFLLFLRLPTGRISEKTGRYIQTVSKCTLFIYLFHPFVLEHLDGYFGLNTLSMEPLISVPVISLFVFAICLLLALAISRIPYLNRLLL